MGLKTTGHNNFFNNFKIFYQQQVVEINLSDADFYFRDENGEVCEKDQAEEIIITRPGYTNVNGVVIRSNPELYYNPFATLSNGMKIPEGYVTEDSWNSL